MIQDPLQAQNIGLENTATRFVASDIEKTWDTIEPSVFAICNSANTHERPLACSFQLEVSNKPVAKPNAKTWKGKDGIAHISVNSAMLRMFQNIDEIAFVLAHEAAHTVANHHGKIGHKNLSGGFTISHDNSQYMELEADVIGSVIAANSGFDPVKGADLLTRLTGGAEVKSKSHPELKRRLEAIAKTSGTLRQGHKILLD